MQLGEVPTPWSAFSIVSGSSNNLHKSIKEKFFPALYEGINLFLLESNESNDSQSINRIIEEFKHTEEDARTWFERCR